MGVGRWKVGGGGPSYQKLPRQDLHSSIISCEHVLQPLNHEVVENLKVASQPAAHAANLIVMACLQDALHGILE